MKVQKYTLNGCPNFGVYYIRLSFSKEAAAVFS